MKSDKKTVGNKHPESPKRDKASGFFVGNNQHVKTSQFGSTVRAKRNELGMTQAELAKLAGLNRSYLSELERGLTGISLERAEQIAKALNCNLRDLL